MSGSVERHATSPSPRARTAAVVALKRLAAAKSRFEVQPTALRAELAWCMALDTMQALRSALDRVVLVTDEPTAPQRLTATGLDIEVVEEPPPRPGVDSLNRALVCGLEVVIDAEVAMAVLADLPALRPESVRRVAAAAQRSDAPLIVPDADGVGTTILAGRPDALVPRFGGSSARRHRRYGNQDMPGLASLADARADVDHPWALRAAMELGVGWWTQELLDRHPTLFER